jgi:hypothetical protein
MDFRGKICLGLALITLVLLIGYIGLLHQWAPPIPSDMPSLVKKNFEMEGKVAAASAIQEQTGLLTTLLLAVTAFFAFAISKHLDTFKNPMGAAVLLAAVYCVPLAVQTLCAYGTYRTIAIQLDGGYFFLSRVSDLILWQTRCLIICVVLSCGAFFWRCFATT